MRRAIRVQGRDQERGQRRGQGRGKSRRFFWLFFCLLALVLGGCGEVAKEEEPLYEIVMQWPGEGDAYEGLDEVEEALNDLIRDRIRARVRFLPSMATEFDAQLMITQGRKLDLCVSLYGGLPELVQGHYVMELDGLLEREAGKLRDLLGIQLAGGFYQDHVYGIPTIITKGNRFGLLCRSDIRRNLKKSDKTAKRLAPYSPSA